MVFFWCYFFHDLQWVAEDLPTLVFTQSWIQNIVQNLVINLGTSIRHADHVLACICLYLSHKHKITVAFQAPSFLSVFPRNVVSCSHAERKIIILQFFWTSWHRVSTTRLPITRLSETVRYHEIQILKSALNAVSASVLDHCKNCVIIILSMLEMQWKSFYFFVQEILSECVHLCLTKIIPFL